MTLQIAFKQINNNMEVYLIQSGVYALAHACSNPSLLALIQNAFKKASSAPSTLQHFIDKITYSLDSLHSCACCVSLSTIQLSLSHHSILSPEFERSLLPRMDLPRCWLSSHQTLQYDTHFAPRILSHIRTLSILLCLGEDSPNKEP